MKTCLTLILPMTLAVVACSGTGADYTPITDGAPTAEFQSDLTACREVSKKHRWDNAEAREDIVISTVLGAVLGAANGNSGSALGGALVGAVGSSVGGGVNTRDDRKDIVVSCIQQRGHNVVG
ncbi:MAG: glycine zipper family protein [Rhodobacteraceae bacterium]|nr:glycine zipper family protein [Paracoccaceae bacterium]